MEIFQNNITNFYVCIVEESTTVHTPILQHTVIFVQKTSFMTQNQNMFVTHAPCFIEWDSHPKYGHTKLLGLPTLNATVTHMTDATMSNVP
jgi:hypothetical protein